MNKADEIIAATKLLDEEHVFGYYSYFNAYNPDIRVHVALTDPDALKGVDGVKLCADGRTLVYQRDGAEIICYLNAAEAEQWMKEYPETEVTNC